MAKVKTEKVVKSKALTAEEKLAARQLAIVRKKMTKQAVQDAVQTVARQMQWDDDTNSGLVLTFGDLTQIAIQFNDATCTALEVGTEVNRLIEQRRKLLDSAFGKYVKKSDFLPNRQVRFDFIYKGRVVQSKISVLTPNKVLEDREAINDACHWLFQDHRTPQTKFKVLPKATLSEVRAQMAEPTN